jgi:hypothetical protein
MTTDGERIGLTAWYSLELLAAEAWLTLWIARRWLRVSGFAWRRLTLSLSLPTSRLLRLMVRN